MIKIALIISYLLIYSGCKQANQSSSGKSGASGNTTHNTAIQSDKSFSVQFKDYECILESCTEKSKTDVSYEMTEGSEVLNLVEYIPLFPDELKVEIIKYGLKIASLNKQGLLVDLYDKTVMKDYSASYILDKPTGLLILLPFKNLDDYIRSSRYAYLPVSAGRFSTDDLGRLKLITDKSIFSSDNSIAYLQNYIHNIIHFEAQEESLSLTKWKYLPDVWTVPKKKPVVKDDISISSGSTSSTKSISQDSKAPEISFKEDIIKKKEGEFSFFSYRIPWSDAQKVTVRDLVGNIDSRSGKNLDPDTLKNLDDDHLLFVMNYSAIKGHKYFDIIENELVKRLKRNNQDLFFETRAFNDQGVPKLIQAYKDIFPGLRDLDIEDVPTGNLLAKMNELGPDSKKAFLVHADGGAHRNLVYLDNSKKTVYLSDSVGLKDDAYNVFDQLEGSNYTVYTHDALRQTDGYNCSVFCLMDVRKIDDPVFVKGGRESSPLYEDRNGFNVSNIIPADLLVATQSINKLRQNQEIGSFLEAAKKEGKDFETVEGEFKSKYINPLNDKFERTSAPGDYSKLQFAQGYERSLKELYDNDDLRQLYFFQKSDVDSGKTPLESASIFEEGGINTYSTVIRSMLLSRIAQRNL